MSSGVECKGATSTVLKDISVDDHFVGVSAVAADGSESVVSFAGPEPRAK